ncbi:MAG: hypothetical protein ACTSSK_03265 [Candidatus Heimdallarchaeota archaeon]
MEPLFINFITLTERTLPEKIEYSNEINIRFAIRGPLYDGSKNSMSRVTINISKRERPISLFTKLLITTYPEIPSFELSVLDVETYMIFGSYQKKASQ